ncbi:MAG: T9SS type A sorting domain-containing protein [Bacteroidetes bacterium]|nr:T9SS type A sorting domain-containing protein [Bacteroidota bacterium]MDA0904100.1 T9SS type A sorting domain-containing protein [Bacteroidota bacterium]MDA1243134.1 T9SS type A sorting domain-containing protein [Bacteroidota bacterium]
MQLLDGEGYSWNFSTAALGEVLPPYPRSRGGSYNACLVNGTYTLEVGGSTWPEEQFVTITDYLEYVGSGTHSFTVNTSEPCDSLEILCFDTWEDGWDSGTFEIQNDAGELVLEGTLSTGSFPDPGAGWQNEFQSFSIPLDQTAVDASPLDLSHVVEVCFQLGGVGHATTGAIALDDVALISSGQSQTTDLGLMTQTSLDMGWTVFPNPATSSARVQPPDPAKPWRLEVWDLRGRSVWRQSGSFGVAILPVQTWHPGGYVVRLEQEGSSTSTILMVH